MSIRLLEAISIAGIDKPIGTTVTGSADWEAGLVTSNKAVYVQEAPIPNPEAHVMLDTGAWQRVPSVFRLLLNGTGTITLDSRDAAGTITSAYAIYTKTDAVNDIEWPYPGADAVEIRATLTGTLNAEVL